MTQDLRATRRGVVRSTFLCAFRLLVLPITLITPGAIAQVPSDSVVMASTTSTEQSGLFGYLLPKLSSATGIQVKVVAVGTGQALDMGRRGDADVLFVHDQAAEEKFIAEGYGIKRYPVMYNDFVLVGPASDPAKVKGQDIVAALKNVAAANADFVSRGDKSGTDAAERRLWSQSGLGDAGQPLANERKGSGYRECGCGMGPALNIAASSGAYVLADRGTWLSFKNRADLAVLVEGDKRLFNPYGVIAVNPARYGSVNYRGANAFIEWITGPGGRKAIGDFRINGEQQFFPALR